MSDSKLETNADLPPPSTQQDGGNDTNAVEKPKGRRGSAGRPKVSQIMRHVEEGQALLKEMGHTDEPEVEGRRRTRSSARGGPPTITPPPVKRERRSGSSATPSSAEKKKATPTPPAAKGRGRGRGRRKKSDADVETTENNGDVEMHDAEDDATEAKVDATDGEKAKPQEESKVKEASEVPAEPKPTVVTPSKEEKKVNDVAPEPKPKVEEVKPEAPKKEAEKIPTPVKEPPVIVEKVREPSPAKIVVSPPVVEAKKEEKKEMSPVVTPVVASVTNSSLLSPTKKVPSLDAEKEVKAQSPVSATHLNSANNGTTAAPKENSTVSPQKAD